MVTPELISYVTSQLQNGASKEQIKQELLAKGWQPADIDDALLGQVAPVQATAATSPQKIQPQETTQITDTTIATARSTNRFKKLLRPLLIVGGVILILSLGTFAYSYFFPSPEMVISRMFANAGSIKSLAYEGTVKMVLHTNPTPSVMPDPANPIVPMVPAIPLKEESTFDVVFAGESDLIDLNKPKGKFSLSVTTDALGAEKASIGMEQIYIDQKIMYIRLVDMANIPFFDLQPLRNQWIQIDMEPYTDKVSLSKDRAVEITKAQEISDQQLKQISDVAKKYKIFVITDTLSSEMINNNETYHYKYTIDKVQLKLFIVEVSQVLNEKKLSEKEIKDATNKIEESMKDISNVNGEIWIGKKDFYLYKVTLSLTTSTESSSSEMDVVMSYKDYNKPIQVAAPTGAITMEEAMQKLFASMVEEQDTAPLFDL